MSYSAKLYMHDLDRKVTGALNTFPSFVKLLDAYNANFNEKAARIDFLSSAIRLSEKQMPEIYDLLPPVCEKLGIDVPELYYIRSKEINAATYGSVRPFIYITSEMVDMLPGDLIPTVLAHECGHIACKHTLYHSIASHLINGIENSLLGDIPAIRRYLTPSLVNALMFWDRCSELSADRAAVLCDETADKTVDVLLRISGYGNNIDRSEFMKQAMDLHSFVNDSKSNKLLEQMLIQGEDHPRLATRAYECCEWSKTEQYRGILDGTYTLKEGQREEDICSTEIVSAEMVTDMDGIDKALERVGSELDRYTNRADKTDYAFAVLSGIMAGAVDALFIGDAVIGDDDIALSHRQVNNFIQQYAGARGFDRERLKDAIGDLEKAFKVAQDNVWKGAGIGVSAKNHHLADLAHHPTPLGLVSAMIVQFLRIGTFVNKDGEWHFIPVKTQAKDIAGILIPAVMTGVLNWIVNISVKKYEEDGEEEVPAALRKLMHLVASTPMIVELAKCADNWFGHLVSDMGGSKNTAGGGMGIPGIFVSLLYEFASLPGIKDTGLPLVIDRLYEKEKMDLRHEIPVYKDLGKQVIPVALLEICVRTGYFISRLASGLAEHGGNASEIDWKSVIPFNNRTVDRMLAVANMTFTVADTADAAVHAAIESGGNWVLFSGHFVTRFNFAGAGRAALAIVKEISNEKKEIQLIHEKMILSEAKAALFLERLQEFKAGLEERVSGYLAEDISAFMSGFEYMSEGLASGDSGKVIKGNLVIQKVLGREPQFTSQEEFDELMGSDIPLTL